MKKKNEENKGKIKSDKKGDKEEGQLMTKGRQHELGDKTWATKRDKKRWERNKEDMIEAKKEIKNEIRKYKDAGKARDIEDKEKKI